MFIVETSFSKIRGSFFNSLLFLIYDITILLNLSIHFSLLLLNRGRSVFCFIGLSLSLINVLLSVLNNLSIDIKLHGIFIKICRHRRSSNICLSLLLRLSLGLVLLRLSLGLILLRLIRLILNLFNTGFSALSLFIDVLFDVRFISLWFSLNRLINRSLVRFDRFGLNLLLRSGILSFSTNKSFLGNSNLWFSFNLRRS